MQRRFVGLSATRKFLLGGKLHSIVDSIRYSVPYSHSRVEMQGEPQAVLQDRDKSGRYRPGFNPRISKRLRVEARLRELVAEYFPNGGHSVMDANRLKLAAQHYFTAETSKDAVVGQRATRVAEYLLSKLKPPPAPRSPAVADQAAQALALLANKESPDGNGGHD